METYQYPPSYPDSGHSSPRSRDIDFDNQASWEDQQNYKAKFMCSYGGKIQPRSHDNQLSYIGGDTKILAVDRNIKFQAFLSKLSTLCDAIPQEISFKYQLPGEELDALISVTTEDDLEHLMHEYDRLYRPSSKPVRMRLFIFITPNSGSISQPELLKPQSNADFLFGLDNKTLAPPVQVQPPSYAAVKYHEPVPDLVAQQPEYPPRGPADDSVEIQRQLQRLQVSESEQSLYRRSVDGFPGGYAPVTAPGSDYYPQKMLEKAAPSNSPTAVHQPAGYWPEKQFSSEGFPMTGMNASGGGDQHVYMMPTPGTFYHAPQVMRPPTAQVTQGYYAVQRMSSDGYREQPVYGGVQPQNVAFSSAGQGNLAPAQQVKPLAYAEGYGLVRPAGIADNAGAAGYAQVAYDSASGRQIYYTAPGGMVHAPQYQGVAPVFSNDMRPAAAPVGQDPKGVNKGPQG
ncbi:uncharacterized protein LOC131631362 [Vicia villosa]|uniref:uncharacterized protein LOC131631362 n=1 Tax=Vicia villosa TaxID=3911 RepID=UPI00273C34E4|nr:uncharacterized protein LOC131631362 [Vicia villosa]